MDKQTKLLLGLGLVAAGGYLLWMQNQKKASFAGVGKRKLLKMTGGVEGDKQLLNMTGGVEGNKELLNYAGSNPVGRRMRMSGKKSMAMMAGGGVDVKQSTFNAAGSAPYAGAGKGFFAVKDSGWQGFTGGTSFFQVEDSGWQG